MRWQFGIATFLTVAFGGLALFSTGIMLFFSLDNALESTRNQLGARLEALIDDAEQKSLSFFQPVERQARWLAEQIAQGRFDPNRADQFTTLMIGALADLPQVSAVSFQFPDGTGYFYGSEAAEHQMVEWPMAWRVQLNRSQTNPQTRPPSNGVWVLRPSVLDGNPESTFIVPARTDTGDIGVVAMRMNLSGLSTRLETEDEFRGNQLVRFILFDNTIVVAHPELLKLQRFNRVGISEIDDPYLKELGTANRQSLAIVGEIPDVETFELEATAGDRVFALKTDKVRESGGEITIGVHFGPNAAATEIRRLITVGAVGLFLLVASMIAAYILGRWASSPVKKLAHAAQLVQSNDLNAVEPLPESPVIELGSAAKAFNAMVDGLRERAKIRDLFGRYVPQDVARLLLSDDQTAEPANATATVLFLDIVGFSSISERLGPGEVVETMNAFFSRAVEIIEAEGGMVTQFQGDAVLAVFNVPVEIEDHAGAALRAALSISRKIDEETYAGQKLNCRIGINTGPLVAGAIGAKDRLSYTVYGDAVNVAARLEQLNKDYGTRILAAAGTVERAEGFEFERIGKCSIRGRKEAVEVFKPV